MGHNHVIASRDVQGFVWLGRDFAASRADLYFPVSGLIVDDPALRTAAGFDADLSTSAIERTRSKMLSPKLLHGLAHPFISAEARPRSGAPECPQFMLTFHVKGIPFQTVAPVALRIEPQRLVAEGELLVNQTDLGLTPFSVLGGALTVEDGLRIRYRLVAVPSEPWPRPPRSGPR